MTVHDPVSHSGDPRSDGLRWKSARVAAPPGGPADRAWAAHAQRAREPRSTVSRGKVDAIPHGLLGQNGGNRRRCADASRRRLLFFGRMEPYKGLGYLLDAADLLRSRGQAAAPGAGRHRQRPGAVSRAHPPRVRGLNCWTATFRPRKWTVCSARATAVVLPYTDATQSGIAAMALANSRPGDFHRGRRPA